MRRLCLPWPRRLPRLLALIGFCLALPMMTTATAATPEPLRLATVFGEHMVLQRDQPLRLWGRGAPGERVQLSLAGHTRQTQVDAAGRWQLQLPALPAGGPHTLSLEGSRQTRLADIWIGDVWLCGGQSNMEWPLALAADGAQDVALANQPLIRHLRVPTAARMRAQDEIAPAPWQVAGPATAGGFSAVAYHFARRMLAAQGSAPVAIGLVNVAWGGSHLETWTRRDAALADPDLAPHVRALPADDALFSATLRDRVFARVARWQPGLPWKGVDSSGWAAPELADDNWPTLAVPEIWESQGLDGLDGVVWYRKSFDLTAAQAAGDAVLHLSKIDDCDDSYVNGQRVGGICRYDAPRRYEVPARLLRAGRNVVAVRVLDIEQGGGIYGDPAMVRLDTAAGSVPLAGRWRARVAEPKAAEKPQANDAPTLAHNGMIQPLQGLGLRGVLWYQGESNVGRAEAYAGAFQRLITDWRQQFAQADLPFVFVQLAAFRPLAENDPNNSPWAELRDAQRQALALPHTGMAVAIDIGDADDIHPRDKRSVGERLALLALQAPGAAGPQLQAVQREGAALVLRFQGGGTLATRPAGSQLQGFAVADASRRFRPALARIEGGTVRVWHPDVSAPVAVRYGWVNNPAASNLIDGQGLPASPFRSDDWPWTTAGQRYAP